MSTTEQRNQAFEKLNVNADNKLILSLDGGGVRGILTLQLLKKLEEQAGLPCYQLFDMVAGTSTGGIIAGLIAFGKSAEEIEVLYKKLVYRVFKKRNPFSNRYIKPPKYTKEVFREALKDIVGNITLEETTLKTNTDLLITAKDLAAGEETYFTCFDHNETKKGTYKDVLLRSTIEATMSAPTYFYPLERFVDGGTTTHNNPVSSAILEALEYGGEGKYEKNKITVFSFGTGISQEFIDPRETLDPKGLDIQFWLKLVMRESSQDASEMQMNLLRSDKFFGNLDLRRFQLSLDENIMKNHLPNRPIEQDDSTSTKWLRDLTDKDLKGIDLDDTEKFDLLQIIGNSMAEYIMENGAFSKDLIDDSGKDLLISRRGDIDRIQSQLSSNEWLDNFKA